MNKVNTKAVVRLNLDAEWIPLWAKHILMDDSHYVKSSRTLLVTSTEHRSQAQNLSEALEKLHTLISTAASFHIKNETTEEQRKHVMDLVNADKARKKVMKTKRSEVKRERGNKDL